jgi:hypothetical protein
VIVYPESDILRTPALRKILYPTHETSPIKIISKYFASFNPPGNHMMGRPRSFQLGLSRHDLCLTYLSEFTKLLRNPRPLFRGKGFFFKIRGFQGYLVDLKGIKLAQLHFSPSRRKAEEF